MSVEAEKRAHAGRYADRRRRIDNALRCLKLVRELVPFESVVDFGCGIGAWLHAAEQLGAKTVLGFEGEWVKDAETVIPKHRIKTADLGRDAIDLAKRFDLALTIEVAEHLPESSADRFCASLVAASDHILFSAASPGQGGVNHLNEQPLAYWVSKLWALGYVPLEAIRPFIARDATLFPWLRRNLVMFVSYEAFIRSERYLRFARPLGDFSLRYAP